MKQEEKTLQIKCVSWFNAQFPALKGLLIAVPNGGTRNKLEAVNLKKGGVVSGVSDLILFYPNKKNKVLFIEMKTKKGRQTNNQKEWQNKIEKYGYIYLICRSLEEFIRTINSYFKNEI